METEQLSIQQVKEHAKKASLLRSAKWNNRRKMAYIALFSILAVTYCCLFKLSDGRIKTLENIISWFYITMSSIVGSYMGFSTLDDKWTKDNKTNRDE